VATEQGTLLLAEDLVAACLARYKRHGTVIATAKGAALEHLAFRHPFYDRNSPVYLGDFVTLEQGTGIVHSSPAYGIDDFNVCRRYGMRDDDMLNPVQGDGRYAADLPLFGGLKIWDANPKIVEKLREVHALLHAEKYVHSYMHCWRHRTPIIYRATTQWFAGMEEVPGFRGTRPPVSLRSTALAGIEATQFFPAWGKSRLYNMIAHRPDWTLSRQRQWGVPLPFFVDKVTDELHPDTPRCSSSPPARCRKAASRHGSPPRTRISASIPPATASLTDTLDVWFDSGSTHQTVMGGPEGRVTGAGSRPQDTGFPADLYLEGSDQHRGWFHSSLLVSCMRNGVPPYKALLTHGFVVDGDGRKMSKSKGNVVAPQKIADSLGAEILRLWVASTDFSGDMAIGDEILKRVVESYRRIRNTLRFLIANTADFDAARDAVPIAEMLEIDRFAMAQARALVAAVTHDYANYDFHLVVQRLQTYCSETLGGLLPRRAEGSALHVGARRTRTPLGADGAGADSRRAAGADGAGAVVHCRGSVADRPSGGSDDLRSHVGQDARPRSRFRSSGGEVGPDSRRARRRAEGARGCAPGRRHRLVAAGGSDDHCAAERLRATGGARRRSALRADHVGGARGAGCGAGRDR